MNEQNPADLAEIAEEMDKARRPNPPKRLKERHPDDADDNEFYPWADPGPAG